MSACGDFRALLLHELEGRAAPAELARLSWHEHLLGCGDCRRMLAEEEALEILLSDQPEPRLPAELARRLLARLRRDQHDPLNRLLALDDRPPEVPRGLASRVLERARRARSEEAALDRLLEADAGLAVPERLAERVLAGLASERFPHRLRPRVASTSTGGGSFSRTLTALAALFLAVLVVVAALRSTRALREPDSEPIVTPTPRPAGGDEDFVATLERLAHESLLEKYDLLEGWELLAGAGSSELDFVSTFELQDEVLIELDAEWTDADAEDDGG
jgi:hypothetical protein